MIKRHTPCSEEDSSGRALDRKWEKMSSLRPELGGVDPLTANLVQRVCIGDLPTRAAQQFPSRPAVIDGEVELTYLELERRSAGIRQQRGGEHRGFHARVVSQRRHRLPR